MDLSLISILKGKKEIYIFYIIVLFVCVCVYFFYIFEPTDRLS
jgi:hypothetical protein